MALKYLKPWLFFLALICVSYVMFRWTHVEYIKKQALVTMFTVIEDHKASDTVYKRVLTNWATEVPSVHIIAMLSDDFVMYVKMFQHLSYFT